jgi:hypothetical protein
MQNFDHNIAFWEKRHFFAENCQKSQKIVIITSTPGRPGSRNSSCGFYISKGAWTYRTLRHAAAWSVSVSDTTPASTWSQGGKGSSVGRVTRWVCEKWPIMWLNPFFMNIYPIKKVAKKVRLYFLYFSVFFIKLPIVNDHQMHPSGAPEGSKPWFVVQGSILQNFISAQNFCDKIFP